MTHPKASKGLLDNSIHAASYDYAWLQALGGALILIGTILTVYSTWRTDPLIASGVALIGIGILVQLAPIVGKLINGFKADRVLWLSNKANRGKK